MAKPMKYTMIHRKVARESQTLQINSKFAKFRSAGLIHQRQKMTVATTTVTITPNLESPCILSARPISRNMMRVLTQV